MTTKFRCFVIALMSVWLIHPLGAQPGAPVGLDASIGFVSQNLWRGCYQAGASIQPEIGVSLRGWKFSVWGTTDFDAQDKEIDLMLRYGWGNFSAGITDYWFGNSMDRYGEGHIPELNLLYSFTKTPLEIGYHTVLWGDDGNFSGYLEISYRPNWKDWSFDFTAGITPWGNPMLDVGRFSCTSLSASVCRPIKFRGHFCGPAASLSLICNPHAWTVFWVAGVTFPFSLD